MSFLFLLFVCYHLFSSPYVSVIWFQACNKTIILYSSSPQKIASSYSWRSLRLCSNVINKMLIGTFGSPLAWSWPTAYNARRKCWTWWGLCDYAYRGAEDGIIRSHVCCFLLGSSLSQNIPLDSSETQCNLQFRRVVLIIAYYSWVFTELLKLLTLRIFEKYFTKKLLWNFQLDLCLNMTIVSSVSVKF